MVADMASFGASGHLEKGDGYTSPPDQKGLSDNENSGSEHTETSAEESSDGEDDSDTPADNNRGADELEEREEARSSQESEPPSKLMQNRSGVEELPQPCCEICKALQSHGYNVVTPRKISRGRLLLRLEAEGSYQCSETGLVFEVSQRVQIYYAVLSWSRFASFLRDSWVFAGPIFDVDCDPSILKSIQFPHSLCLAGHESDLKFSVLHIKDHSAFIEPSTDHSGSHVNWKVTSLSPVGPIVKTSQPVGHHGVVLVYKELGQQSSYSFRVYLSPNNHSDIKDIQKEVRSSNKRYVKVEKPPTCQRLLVDKKKYRLMSEPEGDVTPEDTQFTLAVVKMKSYFEAFFEQRPPFKLSLIEADTDQTVWTATIRECDCLDNSNNATRKRSQSRKRSNSTSEEDFANKKTRWIDESDGGSTEPTVTQDMTDKQLMQVARKMGKEWKQVAIGCLDLSAKDLEDIQAKEEDINMTKFQMLVSWRRSRPKGQASVRDLLGRLEDQDDLPIEVKDVLEGMSDNNNSK